MTEHKSEEPVIKINGWMLRLTSVIQIIVLVFIAAGGYYTLAAAQARQERQLSTLLVAVDDAKISLYKREVEAATDRTRFSEQIMHLSAIVNELKQSVEEIKKNNH